MDILQSLQFIYSHIFDALSYKFTIGIFHISFWDFIVFDWLLFALYLVLREFFSRGD